MLIETFIRKQLRLKAHRVTKVETTEAIMIIEIDRLGKRQLRCGVCRKPCRGVHSIRKRREWRDLSMRKLGLILRYQPRRVRCRRCGVRVEDFPWAAVGATHPSTGQCGGRLEPGAELASYGAAFWSELEDGGRSRTTGSGLWLAPSPTAAGTQDRHR